MPDGAIEGVTWMWEARAAPGRGGELAGWVLAAVRGRSGTRNAEVYRGRGQGAETVVAVLHLQPGAEPQPGAGSQAGAGAVPPGAVLPPPPPGLLARPPQVWGFDRVG